MSPPAEYGTNLWQEFRVSHDVGTAWTDLGPLDAPSVSPLAVGVDGRYLCAATSNGVYRVALPQ